MPDDPILILIRQQNDDIAEPEQRLRELDAQSTSIRHTIGDLLDQKAVLESIALRKGLDISGIPQPKVMAEIDAEWSAMSRVDAIQRALREAPGPMHVTDILNELNRHGRTNDTTETISATLAHIRNKWRTVVNLGGARWEWIRAGTNASGHPPYPVQLGVSEETARILAGGDHPENAHRFGPTHSTASETVDFLGGASR